MRLHSLKIYTITCNKGLKMQPHKSQSSSVSPSNRPIPMRSSTGIENMTALPSVFNPAESRIASIIFHLYSLLVRKNIVSVSSGIEAPIAPSIFALSTLLVWKTVAPVAPAARAASIAASEYFYLTTAITNSCMLVFSFLET